MDKVVHFEIPADDMDRAKGFYSNVFGWQVSTWSPEYFSVSTCKTDEKSRPMEIGAINGGIQKRGSRAKSPTVVIAVDDLGAKLEEIKKAGGKIAVPKEEIAKMGYYAQFDDTEGNRIGLFQARKE